MSEIPLASVIMPFFNTERYIEEAIQSVFDQTFTSWELVLIDDGSTDGSTALALDYAERFPNKVRYLQHEGHANKGGSVSRNVGIDHARGHYIALLDADDVYRPEKLERQVAILEAHPEVGALYGATEYWYSWSGVTAAGRRDFTFVPDLPTERVYAPPSLINLIYVEKSAAVPCTCSLLVRRDVLERIGAFEPTFRVLYQDQVLYTKIFSETPVYVMSDCLDRYRQHADSSCHVAKRTGERLHLELAFLEWQVAYLSRREGIPNRHVRTIQRAYWRMRFPLYEKLSRVSRSVASRLLTMAGKGAE